MQSVKNIQIYFLQEEFIQKRNRANAKYAGRHFLAKEEHKDSVVSLRKTKMKEIIKMQGLYTIVWSLKVH